MQTYTVDSHAAVVRTFDDHAHIAKSLQSGKAVFAFQKTFDFGHTLSQRTQHNGTMGNGFIAGHAYLALHFAAGAGDEINGFSLHRFHVGPAGQNSTEMLARRLGSGKYAQQCVGIPAFDRIAQAAQILSKGIQAA